MSVALASSQRSPSIHKPECPLALAVTSGLAELQERERAPDERRIRAIVGQPKRQSVSR